MQVVPFREKTSIPFVPLVVALYIVYVLATPDIFHILDTVNLIFHEAGHPLFSIFGSFIGVLGGSLMQVIIPLLCAWYFFSQQKYSETAVLGMWAGQSIVSVARYARDAVAMQLPLLGGDAVIHDWNYILTTLDVLKHTETIALAIFVLGYSVVALSIVLLLRQAILTETASRE